MAKEKPHWHWPVAWRAEGKAFEFAKNKVVDLFAAGTRHKGRLGLKRLAPTVGDPKIPNATPGVVKVTGFTAAQGDTPFVTNALRGKCAPLRQCHRASLLVNLPGDEMPLLIEMILDLGVN
jgi:hypothetical protein